MKAIIRFWNQPNKTYRNFQLIYLFLTLNFFFPSWMYAFVPAHAIGHFESIGQLLGGGSYLMFSGEMGYVWRVLAAGNVLNLAFMCFLLLVDLKRFYPVLLPLVFMKGFTALAYLWVFLTAYHYPAFVAVFLYDGLSVFLMLFFAIRAHRTLTPVEVPV